MPNCSTRKRRPARSRQPDAKVAVPAPITDLRSLTERLSALPLPPSGYARVYRGQTANYPKMLPIAFRPGAERWNRLWDQALKPLADSLTPSQISADQIEFFAYWFKVIAQHYGPGSPFLDVTKSVEVALWFALHQGRWDSAARFALNQGGRAFTIVCPTIYFTPAATGWIIVIDAPIWEESSVPRHGELVDLSRGPELVARAPRVQRQQGALVAAEEDHDGGDLCAFYACDPIAIAGPFSDVSLLRCDTAYFFPPPDLDPWYANLLRAPLIPQPDRDLGYAYRQSLGVYLVTPDDTVEHAKPFIDRQTQHLRPLARFQFRSGTASLRQTVGAYPEAATYLYLEAPLLGAAPPANLWNQSVLMTGLRPTTAPESAYDGMLLPDVTLNNVLLEFSPLDWAFREAPGDAAYSPWQCRAVWLVRHDDTFWVTFLMTEHANSDFTFLLHRIEYADPQQAFALIDPDGSRSPLVEEPGLAKPLFVTLSVLRDLSRSVKPDPCLYMAMGEKGLLVVRTPYAKLVRPLADEHDLRLHFIRYVHSGARYEGPPPLEAGTAAVLSLDLAAPFEQLTGLEVVYGRVREAEIGDRIVHFTDADASGHSAKAARTLLQWFSPDLGKETVA